MLSLLRAVSWLLAVVIGLVVISVFLHFLLRIAVLLALLAGGYYLYARARQMLHRD